jgi:uncharacterized phage-associated protein
MIHVNRKAKERAPDGLELANFILDWFDEAGFKLTNLTLQKLMFFCHAWSLVRLDKPLTRHQFQAWEFGPVQQYVYHEFKKFGRDAITARAMKADAATGKPSIAKGNFSFEQRQAIREVLSFYGTISATELVRLSHIKDGPWYRAWYHDGPVNPGMLIRDDDIRNFYRRSQSLFPG